MTNSFTTNPRGYRLAWQIAVQYGVSVIPPRVADVRAYCFALDVLGMREWL